MLADDDDDDDVASLAVSDGPLSSTGSVYRPFSAIIGTRPMTTRDSSKRRVNSAFPVSKLPKVSSNFTSNTHDRSMPSSLSRSASKSGRNKKASFYSSSRAEDQLKRELKEMRKRRQEHKPKVFDFANALERERTHYSKTEGEIQDFYNKVSDMQKRPISKWELKNIEARLKLW